MKKKQTAYWIDEKLLDKLKEKAKEEGTTVSDITRKAVEKYIKEEK